MSYIGKVPALAALTASDITDGIISNAKLAQDIISADTALGATPADTDEFLVSDAGVLKRMDYSYIKASAGLSECDQWRITTDYSSNHNANLTANWERNDTAGFGLLGTGMTESSGIFSFPSTGYWLLLYGITILSNGDAVHDVHLDYTANNSSYAEVGRAGHGHEQTGTGKTVMQSFQFDITDISNQKFVFRTSGTSADDYVQGNTSYQNSGFVVFKLGDT